MSEVCRRCEYIDFQSKSIKLSDGISRVGEGIESYQPGLGQNKLGFTESRMNQCGVIEECISCQDVLMIH